MKHIPLPLLIVLAIPLAIVGSLLFAALLIYAAVTKQDVEMPTA